MDVYVVSDELGHIISISRPGDVGEQVSGIARAGVFPESGHQAHLVQLPERFHELPLLELHEQLRLDTTAGAPRLVAAEEFVEPYLHRGLSDEYAEGR
jgi:hypothetical protein